MHNKEPTVFISPGLILDKWAAEDKAIFQLMKKNFNKEVH